MRCILCQINLLKTTYTISKPLSNAVKKYIEKQIFSKNRTVFIVLNIHSSQNRKSVIRLDCNELLMACCTVPIRKILSRLK